MNLGRIASAALALALAIAPLDAAAAYIDFTDDMFASISGQHAASFGDLTITALPGTSEITHSELGLGVDCQLRRCERRDNPELINAREILVLDFDHSIYLDTLVFNDHSFLEFAIVGGDTFAGIALGDFDGQSNISIGRWTSRIWLTTAAWSDYALAGIRYDGRLDLPGTRPLPEPTSTVLFTAGMLLVGGIVTRFRRS